LYRGHILTLTVLIQIC